MGGKAVKRLIRLVTLLLVAALASGCALAPGMYPDHGSLDREQPLEIGPQPVVVPITAGLINRLAAQRAEKMVLPERLRQMARENDYEYRIGRGDVLSITVWEHPQLTIPAGEYRSAELAGHLVDADGSIYYPFVGTVEVAGLTTAEVRRLLTEKISHYIRQPQLDVRVAAFRSKRAFVAGQVQQPTVMALEDRPITLLEAINRAGGATPEADQRNVVFIRDDQRMELDLLSLHRGDPAWSLTLQDGDQLYVPDRSDDKVFVLGEVAQPSTLPRHNGRLSLAEALSNAQGLDKSVADGDRIYVLRGELDAPRIYHLDGRAPDALLLASSFELEARDVIYVATANVSRWNRVLSQLLPTIVTLDRAETLLR